jgi:hypothetical protein
LLSCRTDGTLRRFRYVRSSLGLTAPELMAAVLAKGFPSLNVRHLRGFPRPARSIERVVSLVAIVGLVLTACLPQPPLRQEPAGAVTVPTVAAPVFAPVGPGGQAGMSIHGLTGLVPFPIEQNIGQTTPDVEFLLRAGAVKVGFAAGGPRVRLVDGASDADPICTTPSNRRPPSDSLEEPNCPLASHLLNLELAGASRVSPMGTRASETTVSRFRGGPDEWQSGIVAFEQVGYLDAWAGIDALFERAPGAAGFKSTYVVGPGANPSTIRLIWRGADDVQLDEQGALSLKTSVGIARESAPVAWQDRADGSRDPVSVRFVVDHTADTAPEIGFSVGQYDPARPLIIDPVFVYSGYIGGNIDDYAKGVAVDSAGAAYVVGDTSSDVGTFPEAVGPDLTYDGNQDAFIAKVLPSGTGLAYAGYIGGNLLDSANGVAVDANGAAYVVGMTRSFGVNGFPVTAGPVLTHASGATEDGWVAKVLPAGTGLVYAGFIGGNGADFAFAVAVDSLGAAYVVGDVGSGTNFPASTGPTLTHQGGASDAFIAKVLPNGQGFAYAGYIGSTGVDRGRGVAVDSSGAAYVAGDAGSGTNFPATVGPDTSHNGSFDAFIAKVRLDGTGFTYAGFIGGSQSEVVGGIAVDSSGAAYVVGETNSNSGANGFPFLVGPVAFNTVTNNIDAFIAKVLPSGTGLAYAGYIGPGVNGQGSAESALGVAVDSTGAAYVVGKTASGDFPVFGALARPKAGSTDGFIVKVRPDGSGLIFSSCIGGGADDQVNAVAVRGTDVYFVGDTGSAANPTATGPLPGGQPVFAGPDTTYNDSGDGFVARLVESSATPTATSLATATLTPTATLVATATATQLPTACSPVRPKVSVSTGALGNGRLFVVVMTSASSLTSIRLGSGGRIIDGATVTFANGVTSGTNGFTFTLPANQKQTSFTLTRTRPGAVTVPFVVTDSCGEWQTFAGGGPTAF